MNFELTPEQERWRAVARDLARRVLGPGADAGGNAIIRNVANGTWFAAGIPKVGEPLDADGVIAGERCGRYRSPVELSSWRSRGRRVVTEGSAADH